MRAFVVFVILFPIASWAQANKSKASEKSEPGTIVVPTVYFDERFFGTPISARGDTTIILLDTGDNSRFFQTAVDRLGWRVDTLQTTRGARLATGLPEFLRGNGIPSLLAAPNIGARVLVVPPTDKFDTLMSRRTIGQLGYPWFDGRVWTFDYPARQLLLHERMPNRRSGDREIRFDFRSDSLGRPVNSVPRLPIEVAGDTLQLIIDTGATVWLTDSANAAMRDGGPAERSWSLVRESTLRKWSEQHPTWIVIEKASTINGSDIIQVPSIRIAGVDVGPVWFGTIPDRAPSAPHVSNGLRLDGTLGGDALRFFRVTLDYPNRVARFHPISGQRVSIRPKGHVEGDLRVHSFLSTTFGNERKLRVLVPPGYDAPENKSRRYPVLFLNDGQNVFDSTTSMFNRQEWRADETVAALVRQRRIPPIIVVGIDNAGIRGRFHEYFPWVDKDLTPRETDPQGRRYPEFLVDEVLPFIRSQYRVLAGPANTGVGGSSAGALAAILAALYRPGVFGRLLVESGTIAPDDDRTLRDAVGFRQWPERISLGVGTNESNRKSCDPAVTTGGLANRMQQFAEQLRSSGVADNRLKLVLVPCGRHDENAWADRLPAAVEFLYKPR